MGPIALGFEDHDFHEDLLYEEYEEPEGHRVPTGQAFTTCSFCNLYFNQTHLYEVAFSFGNLLMCRDCREQLLSLDFPAVKVNWCEEGF